MSDPLEREFAQVRKMLDPATRPLWEGVGPKPEHHGLDALSVIERHVQDMEKALEGISGAVDRYDICMHPEADPEDVLWFVRDQARAALPAREGIIE